MSATKAPVHAAYRLRLAASGQLFLMLTIETRLRRSFRPPNEGCSELSSKQGVC